MSWQPVIFFFILACALTHARMVPPYSSKPCPKKIAPEDKAVVCHYEGRISVYKLDPCLCTHVIFSGAAALTDAFKLTTDADVSGAQYLRMRNPSLRAILGLTVPTELVDSLLTSPGKRLGLAQTVARRLQSTQMDGVEMVLAWNASAPTARGARGGLVSLLKALRTELDSHGREKRDYLVSEALEDDVTTEEYSPTWSDGSSRKSRRRATTTTTTTTENPEDLAAKYLDLERNVQNGQLLLRVPGSVETVAKRMDMRNISRYVDYLTVETHNLTDSSEHGLTYHPSRLMGLSDMLNTDSFLDLLTGLGASPSQLIISVPGSATAFTLSKTEETIPRSPVKSGPTPMTQADLCHVVSQGNWTVERDEDLTAPYTFSRSQWIAFEDALSVSIKAKYALVRGIGGISVFPVDSLDWDSACGSQASQLRALHDIFSSLARKSRAALLESLEDEVHQTSSLVSFTGDVKLSPYRIVRIIDTAGSIHVVRKDVQTQFECSRQGYFSHPLGCNRFYRCVKFNQYSRDFTVFEYDCPAGLAFDERWEVCVWPGSLPRGAPCTGSSEIAPVPRARYACPRVEGYYADPENCRWFFACLDHARDGVSALTAYEFRCPFGLVFDASRLLCDWPWVVDGCGNGGVSLLVGTGVSSRIVYEQEAGEDAGRHLASYASVPDYHVSGGRIDGVQAGVVLESNIGLAPIAGVNTLNQAALDASASLNAAARNQAALSQASLNAARINAAAGQAAYNSVAANNAAAANNARLNAAAASQAAANQAAYENAARSQAAISAAENQAALNAASNQAALNYAANQAAANQAALNAASHQTAVNYARNQAAANQAALNAASNQAAVNYAANQAAANEVALNAASRQAAVNYAANQAAANQAALNAESRQAAVNYAASQAAANQAELNAASRQAAVNYAANQAAANQAALNAASHQAAVNYASNQAAANEVALNAASRQAAVNYAANQAAANQAALNAASRQAAVNYAANQAAANQAALNAASRQAAVNYAANQAAANQAAVNYAANQAAANQAALNAASKQAEVNYAENQAAANQAAFNAAVNQARLNDAAINRANAGTVAYNTDQAAIELNKTPVHGSNFAYVVRQPGITVGDQVTIDQTAVDNAAALRQAVANSQSRLNVANELRLNSATDELARNAEAAANFNRNAAAAAFNAANAARNLAVPVAQAVPVVQQVPTAVYTRPRARLLPAAVSVAQAVPVVQQVPTTVYTQPQTAVPVVQQVPTAVYTRPRARLLPAAVSVAQAVPVVQQVSTAVYTQPQTAVYNTRLLQPAQGVSVIQKTPVLQRTEYVASVPRVQLQPVQRLQTFSVATPSPIVPAASVIPAAPVFPVKPIQNIRTYSIATSPVVQQVQSAPIVPVDVIQPQPIAAIQDVRPLAVTPQVRLNGIEKLSSFSVVTPAPPAIVQEIDLNPVQRIQSISVSTPTPFVTDFQTGPALQQVPIVPQVRARPVQRLQSYEATVPVLQDIQPEIRARPIPRIQTYSSVTPVPIVQQVTPVSIAPNDDDIQRISGVSVQRINTFSRVTPSSVVQEVQPGAVVKPFVRIQPVEKVQTYSYVRPEVPFVTPVPVRTVQRVQPSVQAFEELPAVPIAQQVQVTTLPRVRPVQRLQTLSVTPISIVQPTEQVVPQVVIKQSQRPRLYTVTTSSPSFEYIQPQVRARPVQRVYSTSLRPQVTLNVNPIYSVRTETPLVSSTVGEVIVDSTTPTGFGYRTATLKPAPVQTSAPLFTSRQRVTSERPSSVSSYDSTGSLGGILEEGKVALINKVASASGYLSASKGDDRSGSYVATSGGRKATNGRQRAKDIEEDVEGLLDQYSGRFGGVLDSGKDEFISRTVSGSSDRSRQGGSKSRISSTSEGNVERAGNLEPDTPVVVVSRPSDGNPLLVSKLGAQCTCRSPTLRLRGPGRNRNGGRDNDGSGEENYSRRRGNAASFRSTTPDYQDYEQLSSTVGRKGYATTSLLPVVELVPSTTQRALGALPYLDSVRVSAAGSRGYATTTGAYDDDDDEEDEDAVVISNSRAGGRRLEVTPGPVRARSREEPLQASIDCQRPGLFRHPRHCDKFYACHWDQCKGRYTLHVFNCPVHLAYDQGLGACNWPSKGPACAQDNLLI